MAFLAKVAQPAEVGGDLLTIRAPGRDMVQPRRGDRIFLWWSEAQGGHGLAARGQIFDARRDGRDWIVQVEPLDRRSRTFGRRDLAPFRDVDDGSALAALARDFYRHSHNKIAPVSIGTEAFLDGYFET
jgi:hypothetical protein